MRNLSIDMKTLVGTIPSIIGSYPSLERLHLATFHPDKTQFMQSNYPLHGTVPSSISELQTLKSLRLENTNLGGILKDLKLANLEAFSISGSPLLAVHLGALLVQSPKLQLLDISGAISESIGDFPVSPSLLYLYDRSSKSFWRNDINLWSAFPNIRRLVITNAPRLFNTISPAIGNLTQLEHLDLSDSSFTGTLPPSIGNCLALETLIIANTNIFGPIPSTLCQLHALTHLDLSSIASLGSTIPNCLGELTMLKTLKLSSNGLTGTIPPSFGNLTLLQHIHLDNNALEGHLPDFNSSELETVDVHNNRISGSIPRSTAARASVLILSDNFLSASLTDLFVDNQDLAVLDISHNYFTGPLPQFASGYTPQVVNMSRNAFVGEVPVEYCGARYLELAFNQLTSLAPLFDTSIHGCQNIEFISVGNNKLRNSFILRFTNFERLKHLSLTNNHLTLSLPLLPSALEYLDLSNNLFTAAEGLHQLSASSLVHVDLSNNLFSSSSPRDSTTDFFGPNIAYLSFAHNRLENFRGFFPTTRRPVLTVLDLTNTSIPGFLEALSSGIFPNLVILKIAHNNMNGNLDLTRLLAATQLDMSFNKFAFDASKFSSMPLLISLTANYNRLYGALVLYAMPNLQTANFSANALDQIPDFTTIGDNVRHAQLRVLDISYNPIPPVIGQATENSGLARTSSSAPSIISKDSVTCYTLSFWNMSTQFAYDEGLFEYEQCECSEGYFGAPPAQCLKCPVNGASPCVSTPPRFYLVLSLMPSTNGTSESPTVPPPSDTLPPSSIIQNLLDTLQEAVPILFSFGSPSMRQNMSAIVIQTESCLVTTVQTLSGRSNCKGAPISAFNFNLPGFSLPNTLDAQCEEGSTGRLCSQCICETHGNETCWYPSGPNCAKCRRVFSLSTSIPIAGVLLVLSIAVMSIIMAIVLRRRRIQSRTRFAELSLIKRTFHRVMYLKTLGNLPIMITFLQTLIAFTGWDASARLEFLNLLNGKSDGLGLRCLFPFLSDPLWSQIAELSVPFVLCCIVAISVLIGGFAAKFKFNSSKASKSRLNSDFSGDELDKLMTTNDEILIEYPTMALLSSLVITVIKFFYFGTALAAHQYLFSSRQSYTGVKYIQYNPWMRSSEATTLIMASIPAILIFDLIIPLSFIFICWRVRNTFHLPSVRIYYGSIFETYRDRCFWWEIVNTLKKLAIAFVLKALPPTDALQSALIVSIISGVLLIQVTIRPWKREIENFFDTASALLLIGALLATRPSTFAHLLGVVWYMWALSVLFVVASVGILIWQTVTGKTECEKVLEEFEDRNMLDGHIHTIVDGNMTDSWNLMDSATNS